MPGVSIVGVICFGGHLLTDEPPLRKVRRGPLPRFPIRQVLTQSTLAPKL
jgi:hypothetical protein